jgi:hypothetical protein
MEYTFYIIYCKDENIPDCYVGSTINLDNRKKLHKSDCNNKNSIFFNFRVYKFIRDNGGFDNWIFGVLGIHTFDNKKDKLIREQYYIDCYDAKLNSYKAIANGKKNKEKVQLRNKKYYEENKKNILLQHTKYREENREQILLLKKKYYEENKEKVSLCNKEYKLRKKEERLMALNDYRA